MLRLIPLIFLLMLPFLGQTQYFSGEITYEITYIPKSDSLNIEEIRDNDHGNVSTYLITSKHYKSTYYKEGNYTYSYTYDDSTKRMFDDYVTNFYVTFRDSRRSNGEYTKPAVYKDSLQTVLGRKSYLVVKESVRGKTRSYYSDDLKVNYADFKGHKVGNWYQELKAVDGAISLKSITEFPDYYEVRQAVKIDEREVEEREFKLPNKPVAASFSALDQKIEMNQPTEEVINCYREKVGAISKPEGKEYTVYLKFLVKKDGEIEFIEPVEEDESGFYKTAVDIILYCGIEFIPGKIDGVNVDAQMYFPIVFFK